LQKHQCIYRTIKKCFLALQPEEVELSRKWLDGDEIHLGDAVDFATDLLRGTAADGKIYQRKILNIRDVAVLILVDTSSSTGSSVGNLRIIDIAKTALTLLGSALNSIGDTFAIAAFNSDGIPADTGYGGNSGAETNDYAIEDTRRALIECRQAGLVPFCLTIDSSARDYISRLYGDYHYSILNDINLLPQQLSKLYLRLTR
jgi:nitric oxide reductase activation protein